MSKKGFAFIHSYTFNRKTIKFCILLAISLLPFVPTACGLLTIEDGKVMTEEEVSAQKYNEGFDIAFFVLHKSSASVSYKYVTFTANEPVEITFFTLYSLTKRVDGNDFKIHGACTGVTVVLNIYKENVLVEQYHVLSDLNGSAEFTVIFREPGYYRYECYTTWQYECDKKEEYLDKLLYVNQEPKKLTPTATTTPTIDSDRDGVPDRYDYNPYNPKVQTKSDVKSSGFNGISGVVVLWLTVYIFKRRK